MQLEIKSQKEIPLMSRKRVSAFMDYEGATPSLLDVKKQVASQLKAKDDLVAVRHVYPRFGVKKAKVIAHVYENKDVLLKTEDKKTLLKNKFVKTEEELKAEAEAKAKAEEEARAKAEAEKAAAEAAAQTAEEKTE